MEKLIEIHNRLLSEMVPSYLRAFYDSFRMDNRLMGIVGARGVGKTTFLLHFIRQNYADSNQALYVSADNLYFVEHTLSEITDRFVKEYDGKLLCIDEIHRYKNWNQELKNIYDSFPNLQIIFSGSSSIDLIKGQYDLSRRANLKKMYGFSFREFLEIKTGEKYPVITLEKLFGKSGFYAKKMSKVPKLLGYFKEYLKKGYYPTFLTMNSYQAYTESLQAIVNKIIYQDISSFYSLKTTNLDTLKRIIYFFATSEPGSVNASRLANSLKKDYTTVVEYIQMLRDSGLLRFLLQNKRGHALVRHAEKIYCDNSNLLYSLNAEVGKEALVGQLRELFVIGNLQNAGYHVFASQKADVEVGGKILEIEGRSKTGEQLKGSKNGFLVKDDILIGEKGTIPLYLFGFLY